MSDLYSVISGIQPDQQDILEAELVARQILSAKYPDLDLREGTGVRDLVIRPSAFLLAICKKGFDYYFSQNTLDKVNDASPVEVVDDLLSNLFLSRNVGSYSIINARLYFARQKAVSITTNTSFSTDGSILFFPTLSTTYPSTALQFDSFQNEWFLDIDLIAGVKGTSYNISSGSLLYFSNFDPYFLHGEINYLSTASTAPETNTQFLSRAKSSISTRNLINNPSITGKLLADFNYLTRIKNIGAGDVEIFRDQVRVLGGPGKVSTGIDMVLTDGGSKLQISMLNHGYLVGQILDVVESGSSLSKLVFRATRVTNVINANSFKVEVVVSTSPRSFLAPIVTPVEEDIFIHQGGMVDVHCSDVVNSSLSQFTLDSNGKCKVSGPYYSIARSPVPNGLPDTVPSVSTYTSTYAGHTSESDIQVTQTVAGPISIKFVNHPMSIGRMINLKGWPTLSSNLFLTVTNVIDADTFLVGNSELLMIPDSGLAPTLTYVYPTRDNGFSTRQEIQLDFGVSHANQTCTFELKGFENLESIQDYLELSSNRVLCADYLARGFDVYVLDIHLTVYNDVLPTSGYAASLIEPFLTSLATGQDFIISDLVAKLTTEGGISKLQTPLGISYKYYSKDMFPAKTGVVVDALVPENSTSVYLTGLITTSVVNI